MLEEPLLANTWERDGRGEHPRAVVEAVDPESVGIDPLNISSWHVPNFDRDAPVRAGRRPDAAQAHRVRARAARPPRARSSLYPAGHPAIAATLGRIVADHVRRATCRRRSGSRCCPTACCSTSVPPARADAAVAELAALLHSHLIGAADRPCRAAIIEAWRNFLLLLGRAPESVRAEGGIARVWTTTRRPARRAARDRLRGGPARTHRAAKSAAWDKVIANCLQGDRLRARRRGHPRAARHRGRREQARRADGDARVARRRRPAASARRPRR